MIRLLFVGASRITESVITLSFDRYLDPRPEHTFIHFGPINADLNLLKIYKRFGIDTNDITVIDDADLLWRYYPSQDIYKFGGHIAQQLIKFIALDNCDSDKILIQDCDTFALESYQCFQNGKPVPFVLANDTHTPQFYEYFTKFTGQTRQTTDSFVTEFMPVLKEDWIGLRSLIEERYKQPWLSAFLDEFSKSYPKDIQKSYFSEYELLGNWSLCRHKDLSTKIQKRLVISKKNLFPEIQDKNCACMTILDVGSCEIPSMIRHFNATVAERPNATDCKSVKP